jgi:hypothetical protein
MLVYAAAGYCWQALTPWAFPAPCFLERRDPPCFDEPGTACPVGMLYLLFAPASQAFPSALQPSIC